MAASSSSSSNVTPTPVLDEIFSITGESVIPKAMKVYFEQERAEEELDEKYIQKKLDHAHARLIRVRLAIREMESLNDEDEAWVDSIDCFKESKIRLERRVQSLTNLGKELADGVKEITAHSCIMDLAD